MGKPLTKLTEADKATQDIRALEKFLQGKQINIPFQWRHIHWDRWHEDTHKKKLFRLLWNGQKPLDEISKEMRMMIWPQLARFVTEFAEHLRKLREKLE